MAYVRLGKPLEAETLGSFSELEEVVLETRTRLTQPLETDGFQGCG